MEEPRRKKRWIIALVIGVAVFLAVFFLWGGDGSDVPGGQEAQAEVLVYRDADVQEIRVGVSNGGVAVVAHGFLADSCTDVDTVLQDRDGSQFYITILSARPEGAACSQVLSPFEKIVPLESAVGLVSGEYSVDVNGIGKKFTIQ